MLFEWDPDKASSYMKKHGVSFKEAASVFGDKNAITFDDPAHSVDEARSITFGRSKLGRLLVVAHTFRGKKLRIISSRKMTHMEESIYYEED